MVCKRNIQTLKNHQRLNLIQGQVLQGESQGTPYGNWLLQQDRKLQIKTLGNEGKVRIFKKLAKKEGSGQAALRKMIRNDGSEVSLARLEQLYGKPRDITTRTKTPKPVAKPVGLKEG